MSLLGWAAVVWPWLSPVYVLAIDTNPDTPTSILAAVVFLGSVIVGGLVYDRTQMRREHAAERASWEADRKELQSKIEGRDAAATNRERQLGMEVFPLVKQMTDVLAAQNRAMAVNLEAQQQQHPVQSSPALDPDLLRRVVDALEAKP